jgi:hypothetical protein
MRSLLIRLYYSRWHIYHHSCQGALGDVIIIVSYSGVLRVGTPGAIWEREVGGEVSSPKMAYRDADNYQNTKAY